MNTKTRPIYIYCLQETHYRPKDTCRMKVKGWKILFHATGKQKKAGVAILISGKIDMIKESIQEEDITIVNTYAPNIGAPQYIGQTRTDIKGETDRNTIIIRDFNTPLTPMGRSSK